jgi:Toastrack DUF4097
VSVSEAPPDPRSAPPGQAPGPWRSRPTSSLRGLHGWNAAVAASAAIVALVVLVTGVGWLATLHSHTTTYTLSMAVSEVDLQVSSGQVAVAGSSAGVLQVSRTDSYSFGHSARERRWVRGGVLHISSHCPRVVVGSCSASYQLLVPEAMAVHVQTDSGDVQMTGLDANAVVGTRTGNVDIEAFCGFRLSALSQSGSLHVASACAPESLSLRTGGGDAVALVPPGSYRLTARSGRVPPHVTGVVDDPGAPFTIDAESAGGSVTVEGGL